MMVAVALLAMALAAAAEQRNSLAIIAACVCAVVAIAGLLIFESTARADRNRHHNAPCLLSESYIPAPPWAHGARAVGGTDRKER